MPTGSDVLRALVVSFACYYNWPMSGSSLDAVSAHIRFCLTFCIARKLHSLRSYALLFSPTHHPRLCFRQLWTPALKRTNTGELVVQFVGNGTHDAQHFVR